MVSLKNKFGIVPIGGGAELSVPNALTVGHVLESFVLNKIVNVLLDIPRSNAMTVTSGGIPRSAQITLGG